MDDGTAGLTEIKRNGGVAVVADPSTVVFKEMAVSAIDNVDVDHVVPLSEIPEVLQKIVEASAGQDVKHEETVMRSEGVRDEIEKDRTLTEAEPPGPPSGLTCPQCGGALWQDDPKLLSFRCRVGHGFAPETLLSEQAQSIESALWAALRALEERDALLQRVAARMRNRGNLLSAARFERAAEDARSYAGSIRKAIVQGLAAAVGAEDGGDEQTREAAAESDLEEDRVVGQEQSS
jgi:two-component system chemotaxis response regulator CheB